MLAIEEYHRALTLMKSSPSSASRRSAEGLKHANIGRLIVQLDIVSQVSLLYEPLQFCLLVGEIDSHLTASVAD